MDVTPTYHDMSSRLGQNNQSQVPFPTPDCMSRKSVNNKYQSVFTSLEVLKKCASLNYSGKATNNESKIPADVRGIKKPVKELKPEKSFQFTKEMFMTSNQSTEAFIQVTHFLFSILNKTETDNRFRDAWPIFEKKQESLYRRAALAWFKDIIMQNSSFFMKGVEGQLQGLIVNPYGDRFIRFLHSFLTFVMFTVSIREDSVPDEDGFKDHILYKQKFSGKFEVTKRQATLIDARTERLEKQTVDWMKTRYRNKIIFNDMNAKILNLEKQAEKRINKRIAVLIKLIPVKPYYFPENAIDLLQNQEQYFLDEFSKYPKTDLTAIDKIPPNPLNTRNSSFDLDNLSYVDNMWKERMQLLGDKVNKVTNFFQRYSRLWTLSVLIPTQKPVVLDVSKLHFSPDCKDNQQLSVHKFFDDASTVIQKFRQKLESIAVSKDLLDKVQSLNSKVEEMKQTIKTINETQCPDVKQLKKQVAFELSTLYIRLENVDWSKFSQVHDPPLSSMFSFSPIRPTNASKATGLTPTLSTYLNFENNIGN